MSRQPSKLAAISSGLTAFQGETVGPFIVKQPKNEAEPPERAQPVGGQLIQPVMPSNVSGPNGAAASVMSASRERRDEVRGRLNGYGAPYSHSGQTQSVFLPDNWAVMVVRKQTNLLANYVNSVGVHRASAGFVSDNHGAALFAAGQNEQSGGLCWGGEAFQPGGGQEELSCSWSSSRVR